MGARGHRIVAWVGGTALVAAHLVPWRAGGRLHLGWIPEELLLRLVWMAAAFLYLVHVCARVWPASRDEDVP